jgi:hypothetical protein
MPDQLSPAGPNVHKSPELAPHHAATHIDAPLGRSPGSHRARNRRSERPLASRNGRAGVHGSGHRRRWIRIETRRADIGITEAAYPANGRSAFEAMILTQPVPPADFRLVIIEIEIEKR